MRLMIAAVAFSLSLLFATSPAPAQAPPPEAPSPEALAAARELVVASRAADQVKRVMPLLMQQLKPAIVQGRPEVDKAYDAVTPILLESLNNRLQEFIDRIAPIYARNFTAGELGDIAAFYRTPTGQKLLEKLPGVMQQSLAVGQQFGQTLALDMQQRILEEMKKRGYDIKL
jgi:hypothetical protein